MRIVFMGTPDIAAACLEKLLTEHMNVVAYILPDTPKTGGMKLTQSPVKRAALAHEISRFISRRASEAAAVEELRALKPDVIAVVAYAGFCLKWCWIFLPGAASTSTPALRRPPCRARPQQ